MLLLQNGTREVDAGEPEKLQPSGHGEPAHDPGVPAVVVGDHADVRQRRHVEPAVGAVGEALLGAAALHQRVVAGEVLEGRVQHAGDGADLWRRAASARGRLAHGRCAPGATLAGDSGHGGLPYRQPGRNPSHVRLPLQGACLPLQGLRDG
ncbi:hypothetical protein B296_00035286 [Ensete ventricosum]|uniref:Uncharacterized protein n=1 Tax=Ensete ventricosum TaxID=4639 RepID=A0A426XC66_ENSVE|nr:hypothetical protein B296_00035286 [Ensete ventricosum]